MNANIRVIDGHTIGKIGWIVDIYIMTDHGNDKVGGITLKDKEEAKLVARFIKNILEEIL